MTEQRKTTADYAAIAVAPMLIFLMISSLAQFFVLLFYDGGFGTRVSWILLMFTMGTVSLARLSIEQSREYSIGYAIALGLAAFLVMTQYVGNPLATIFILVLIGYLSDRIVHDCTLIDEDIDSSGEGLVDAGRLFVREKRSELSRLNDDVSSPPKVDKAAAVHAVAAAAEPAGANQDDDGSKRKRKRAAHQPGRTVFYLALAALPLFGFGQFFLGGNSYLWEHSKWYLAVYLFSALSLLVTTSFLGLRRYLRQRNADMPKNVSVAWLAGGVGLIAFVLMIAYLSPMPGQAVAAFELPKFLTSPEQDASSAGWGDEAAENSDADSAQTPDDRQPKGKQAQGTKEQKDHPDDQTVGDPTRIEQRKPVGTGVEGKVERREERRRRTIQQPKSIVREHVGSGTEQVAIAESVRR